MKVLFRYKDGHVLAIEMPDDYDFTALEAIKMAKASLNEKEKLNIENVEVEEDFL